MFLGINFFTSLVDFSYKYIVSLPTLEVRAPM